jgi:type I restriction enzyme S subunit
MNPPQIISLFDRVSESRDAIPKLRRLILDLAVRGKLVEGDRIDARASELLRTIQSERARLVKIGKIRKQQTSPVIESEEVPFDVPGHWALVRLGDALELVNGRAFKPNEWSKIGLPIIRIQNLNNPDAPFNYTDAAIPAKFHVKDGDFLISWSGTPGTSFGAHIWRRGNAILNQHIFKAELIGNAFLPAFLKLAINSRLLELIDQAHGGVGLQHVTKPKLERLPLTLPPYPEQQRIVAKVDELMALCDRMEIAQTEREKQRDRLANLCSRSVNNVNGSETALFRESALFYFRHLTCFTARPEQIAQLRQSILSLAVRGKLVPQNPKDEPASELIKRVGLKQAGSIRQRTARRGEAKERLSEDEIPFELPPSWQWAALEDLIVFGPQNGISPKPSPRPDAPRAITLTATTSGVFDSRHFKRVEANVPENSEFWLRPGDLLFQRGNTREYVGIAAFYAGEPGRFLYPDLMMKVRLSKEVNLQYCHRCAIAPFARAYFSTRATGAQVTMPKINQGTLLRLPVPIPPLAEQLRIVAKVDKLMALCDELEGQLVAAEDGRHRLLEAVLSQALDDTQASNSRQVALFG